MRKYLAAQRVSQHKARDCATAEGTFFFFFTVCQNCLNCMLCAVLHCLPLSHPHRTHSLQLLFSQSTRLPPAQPLTRWRGRLRQVVVVTTQDLSLNLWHTHLNLTLHAHRAVPVCSSHRMALSQLPHLPRPRQQINQMAPRLQLQQQAAQLLPFDHHGSLTLISPTVFARTRPAPS